MAQVGDYDQTSADTYGEEGGKHGLLSKIKDKTKTTGKKLKSKLKPGSHSTDDTTGDTGNESYEEESDEETPGPAHNAFTGQTQTAYDQSAKDDTPFPTGPTSAEPASDFPGNLSGIAGAGAAGGETEDLTSKMGGLSTDDNTDQADKPVTEKASDYATSAKDQTADTLTSAKDQTKDTVGQYTSSDTPPATEQLGQQASDTTQAAADKTSEAGKTWTQWAAEKVGYAKDTAAAKAPTTSDGKPVHEAAYDSAVGAKDSAVDSAYGTKDAAATHTDPNQIPSDPSQQSILQKATGAVYGAKDSLMSSSQPGEHDKALSQKVTETVGNLPTTLKSYLPIGGNKAGTTGTAATDSPVSATTDEAAGAPPQSPTLVGRITGLFGGAAKKPATDETPVDSTTSATTTDSSAATPQTQSVSL